MRLMIKEVQKMLNKRNILVMPGVLAVLAVLAGCEKQTVTPEPEEIPSVTLESAQIGTDEANVSMDIPADNEVLDTGKRHGIRRGCGRNACFGRRAGSSSGIRVYHSLYRRCVSAERSDEYIQVFGSERSHRGKASSGTDGR